MTTKNLIPRASGEGGIGITDVTWGYGYYDTGNFNKGLFVSGHNITQVIAETVTQGGLGGEWTKAVNSLDIYYNGGNVGIGTANPISLLHIKSDDPETSITSANARTISIQDTSETNDALSLINFNTSNGAASSQIGSRAVTNVPSTSVRADLFFSTRNSDSTFTEKMTIKQSGNVGIGTTSPGNKLHISAVTGESPSLLSLSHGTSSSEIKFTTNTALSNESTHFIQAYNNDLRFFVDGGTQQDIAMTINFNGNVGIGTRSPGAKLTTLIENNSTYVNFSPNSVDSVLALINNPTNEAANNHATLHFNLILGGRNHVSSISLISESSTLRRGALVFCTDNGNELRPEVMRIDSGGNVGIGTTNPISLLHIKSDDPETSITSANARTISIQDTSETNDALSLINFNTSNGAASSQIGSRAVTNVPSTSVRADLFFSTRNSDSTFTEKMTIKQSGNVGIGTTSPAAKLDILGSFKLNNPGGATLYPSSTDVYKNGTTSSLKHSAIFNTGGWRNATVIESVTGTASPNFNTEGLYLNSTYGSKPFTSASIQVNCSAGNGDISFLTGDGSAAPTSKIKLQNNGNVGIGTTSPGTNKLYVNGNIFANGTITPSSDDRVKHNEQNIIGALETLSKLTPKKYIKTTEMYEANHNFELDADGNPVDAHGEPVEHTVEAGVIAQQVLTVDELAFMVSPEGVDEDGNVTSPHGLNYNSLFTYAIAAIQEQQQLIEDLRSEVEALKNK